MKILDFFKTKKVSDVPPGVTPRMSSSGSMFSIGTQSVDTIMKSIAYPCMKFRADAVSTAEILLTDIKNEPLPETHWLTELFLNPNPYFSQNEILKLIQYWLDINGNAFVYLPKYDGKIPLQMWVLNPTNVTLVIENGYIKGYKYNNNGITSLFTQEDVIHFRNLVPSSGSEFIGTGVAQIALSSIMSEIELNKYTYRYLVNDAMPPMVLESPDDLGEQTWQMYQQSWNAKLPNHKLMTLLHSGMKAVPLTSGGISGSAISIKDLNEVLVNKVTMFFGVPYSKLTGQNTSYNSAIVSDYTFKVDTIKPLLTDMIQKFDVYFKQIDPNLKVNYKDFEYYDQEYKMKETQMYLQMGVLTPNEVRQKLGLEPLKVLPVIQQPVTMSLNHTEIKSNGLNSEIGSLHSEEEIVKFWTGKSVLIDKLNDILLKPISKSFKELEDIILTNYFKETKSLEDNLFTDKEFEKILTDNLTEPLTTSYKVAMKDASININIEFNEDPFEKQIKRYVKESVNNIKIVGQSVKNSISNILINNIESSVDEMADLISEELANYQIPGSQWKGKRIAETTNTYVVNKSSKTIFEQNGYTYKWVTRRDGKVRDSHQALDGKRVSKEGTFTIKNSDGSTETIEFPGQGLPENIINCRCVLMPD